MLSAVAAIYARPIEIVIRPNLYFVHVSDAYVFASYLMLVFITSSRWSSSSGTKPQPPARWALLFIVRAFFNDTITVAVWTGFHVYASWDATTPPRLYSLVPCGSDGCETVYGKVWWRTAPAVLSLLALQILLLVPNWPRFWRRQRRSTGRRRVRLPFVGTDACLIAS